MCGYAFSDASQNFSSRRELPKRDHKVSAHVVPSHSAHRINFELHNECLLIFVAAAVAVVVVISLEPNRSLQTYYRNSQVSGNTGEQGRWLHQAPTKSQAT